MTTNLFGKNDLACVANYGLRKCTKDQLSNFDVKTVSCVGKDFYMDNLFKSSDSEKYLLPLSKELIEMLSNCSFHLTK